MTVLPICSLPDKVLRQKAKKVSGIDAGVRRLIGNMIETMRSASGVGLAAPQVGKSLRIIVVQLPDEEPQVIINPEIVRRSGEQQVTEGCLSVPGYYGEITRSAEVTVKGRDRRWRPVRIKADGLLAEALEHEIDHLDGVLYIDRVKEEDKLYKIVSEEAGEQII